MPSSQIFVQRFHNSRSRKVNVSFPSHAFFTCFRNLEINASLYYATFFWFSNKTFISYRRISNNKTKHYNKCNFESHKILKMTIKVFWLQQNQKNALITSNHINVFRISNKDDSELQKWIRHYEKLFMVFWICRIFTCCIQGMFQRYKLSDKPLFLCNQEYLQSSLQHIFLDN